ncbi:hypothetical protein GQ600_14314 [Phytophthora cactorum]|nr:hypothetical protein GQ600_14314 [Phytophthora cactorum]
MAFRRDLSEHQSSQSGTRIAYTRVRVGAGTRNNPDLREKCLKAGGRVTRRTPIASSGGILGLGDKRSGEYSFESWQLQPDQLEIQHRRASWNGETDKEYRLLPGLYRNSTACVPFKLLVCGEGYFPKHKDTAEEDGMIATLIVQPPSTHKAGDFIVYRDGKLESRHDFGKTNGAAAYFPHYALTIRMPSILWKKSQGYRYIGMLNFLPASKR